MKNKLIHLGLPIPGLSEQLKENFDYIDIPFEKLWEPNAKKGLLFIKGKLNPLYLNALFLITQDAYLKETELLKKLPGNKTLIDNTLTLPLASQNILELKNAQFIEVGDIKALAKDLNQTFYSGQWGFKFTFDNIQFEPYFKGRIEQLGHNYIRFIDQNIQAYQKVANWGGPLGVAGNTLWEIRTEFKRQNPTTDVRLDVSMINPYTNEIYYSQSFENDQLNEVLPLKVSEQGAYILVELFIKGNKVELDVGQISLRKARDGRGTLLVGEKEMVDDQSMNEQLYYYFDPGDFKPPLVVYFSGFRLALGVEGANMMRALEAPALIFGEQRILGDLFTLAVKSLNRKLYELFKPL